MTDRVLDDISRSLADAFSVVDELYPVQSRPASVALLLRNSEYGLELLFIQRSEHPDDPWSGHIGFPGGRRDPDDPDLQYTAERETLEEIGINLSAARYLGQLPDIVGANLPVRVSCFVYFVGGDPHLHLSDEVGDAFWIRLNQLRMSVHHAQRDVSFDGNTHLVDSIDLLKPGKPLLWGITYRLVMQFLQVVREVEAVTPLKGRIF